MPLIATLVDDFTVDQLAVVWPNSYGSRTFGAGRIRLACDSGYNAISSAAAYTLAGSQVHARLVPPAKGGAVVSAYVEMMVESTTPGTDVAFTVGSTSGLITCSSRVAYTDGAAVSQTFDPVLHRFVRFREAGGTVFWERSSDRVSWTVMRSLATPGWLTALTTGKLTVQAHRDDGLPTFAEVDDVNVPAPAAGFPQQPLPVTVWLAPGGDPVDASKRTWVNITDKTRAGAGISVEVGRSDEAGQVEASKLNLTLDNRDGRFSPRNPIGQWYGQLRRNAPLQVRLARVTDTFTRAASASGWGASTSGHAWAHTVPSVWTTNGTAGVATPPSTGVNYSAVVTGAPDIEVLHSFSLASLPVGAAVTLGPVLRYAGTNIFNRVRLIMQTTGSLDLTIDRRAGTPTSTTLIFVAGIATYAAGEKWWIRARAEGPHLMAKAWKDGTTEPATWQATAQDGQVVGTSAGIMVSRGAGHTTPAAWTIDDFSTTVLLATGTIDELPVRWNKAATDSTTPVTASGVLRRLNQGAAALRSPIYRQLSAQPVAAYWPLEDGSDVTVASSAAATGAPAAVTDVEFGSDDCPPGASSAVTLSTLGTSQIAGRVTRWRLPQDGYAALIYFRLPALPSPTPQMFLDIQATGTVVRWTVRLDNTGLFIQGYDTNEVLVVNTAATYIVDPTKWIAMQLETQEVGGTVQWALIWHEVGKAGFWASSGSYAGTADRLTAATVSAPISGTLVSHLWLGDDALPFVDAGFLAVSAGFAGEPAADRVARLGREEGVPIAVAAGSSSPMGPQRTGSLLELLRLCEESDQGVLLEQAGQLAYLPRGARTNRPVRLALDMALGHLAEAPEPVDDDQAVRNDVTVQRIGGGSARVIDDESVDAIGRYDTSVDVALDSDTVLPEHAAWRVHLGTSDELRWPVIDLDLARNPDLIDLWLRIVPGSRITIVNPPSALLGTSIDLIVEGVSQQLSVYSWRATLNCSPARLWTVGVYDDPDLRYDSASTTLASPATATATSWSITTALQPDAWSTTAVPYDWSVAGERVTVTAMTTPAGTGPYTQTATVRRSINGVVKAQTTGTQIRLADPARYAL